MDELPPVKDLINSINCRREWVGCCLFALAEWQLW